MHLLNTEKIVRVLTQCERLIDKCPGLYKDKSFQGHASIDALADYVREKSNTPLIMRDVNYSAERVLGRLERYKDRSEISVMSDQARAMKKFITAKELLHLVIDTSEDWSPYGDERLENLIQTGVIGLISGDSPTAEPTQSEALAEIAAIEVLYPMDRRVHDIALLKKQETSIKKIQLEREMPDHYLSAALNRHYLEYIKTAIDDQNGKTEQNA